MEVMKLFFINQKNSCIFNFFWEVVVILITLFGCYIIIKNSSILRKNLNFRKKINALFASILILQQVFLTIENTFLKRDDILALFPLYISRLSIIFLAVVMLKNNTAIKSIGCYLGLFVGIYSLINGKNFEYSYLDKSVNYFGYMLLLWAIIYIISIEGFKFEKKTLKNVLIFTNAYSILLTFLAVILGNNYNFINGTSSNIYNFLSQGNYIVFSLIFINLSIAISHFLIKFILWEIDVNFKLEYKTIIEKDKLNKAELE